MKVFVAGATGAVGRPLVQQLIEAGHDVVALTRSPARGAVLSQAGATPVVGDALAPGVLDEAFAEHLPEVAVHQLTTFPNGPNPIKALRQLRQTIRLRSQGSALLAEAAKRNGTRRVVAQGIAFVYQGGSGTRTEDDPIIKDARGMFGGMARAIADVEDTFLDDADLEGVILRYGGWYGPGTQFHPETPLRLALRLRLVPAFRRSRAYFNTTYIGDAASAVLAALDGPPGAYNINDNDPIPVAELMHAAANAVGARPPMLSATPILRLSGAYMRHLLLHQPAASNAKAAEQLGWTPSHTSARAGLLRALSPSASAPRSASEVDCDGGCA